MSTRGLDILQYTYGVDPFKVEIIPHGIPRVSPKDTENAKSILGLKNRRLLLTFGLLSPDKGIEDVIEALPQIVQRYPDVLYLVVGATHPHIKLRDGEAYRDSLRQLADQLGVSKHVSFDGRFLDRDDLTIRLQAADIYVTPYRKKEQITSGTLAYAFGMGNAVVSTPYWHAEELLAEGNGFIVPPKCPSAIADSITTLFDDPTLLRKVQESAYANGLETHWPKIALRYAEVFRAINDESPVRLAPSYEVVDSEKRLDEPTPGLRRLLSITDDVGTVQHSKFAVPNRFEGYCLDDNARMVLALSRVQTASETELSAVKVAANTGLSFLHHSFCANEGRFRNFLSYDRQFIGAHSPDSEGRAIWALGSLLTSDTLSGHKEFVLDLIGEYLKKSPGPDSLRGRAFCILGLLEAERAGFSRWTSKRREMARIIHEQWQANSCLVWSWFENSLSYDNAQIAHAVIASAGFDEDHDLLRDGLSGLQWLTSLQTAPSGVFRPVGCDGFHRKGGKCAQFDQQPLEVWATVDACASAYVLESDPYWLRQALNAYAWFFGKNDLSATMVDPSTGGCYDGLTPQGPNRNEGAEATISLVCASTRVVEVASRTISPSESSRHGNELHGKPTVATGLRPRGTRRHRISVSFDQRTK